MTRPSIYVCLAVLSGTLIAACGKPEDGKDPDPGAAQPAADDAPAGERKSKLDLFLEEKQRSGGARALPRDARQGVDPALASIEKMAAKGDEKSVRMAEALRAQYELSLLNRDPNATEAQKKAASDKFILASQATSRRDINVKQPVLDLPPDWAATYRVEKNAREAELVVQVGDIDNLGFGWPPDFDPFAGKPTPVHRFPWAPEADDPPGTDRIMVNSGAELLVARKDGYTRDTYRPDNLPQPLTLEFEPAGLEIKAAVLQLFVDDFQAPAMKTRFSVTLDGRPAPDIETTINKLNQTGPIGKLVTIKLLTEYLGLLADGKLEVLVDDKSTNVGDGFAFDFARLLINPKGFTYSGVVRGIVVDMGDDRPLGGALASAANVRQATTGADGKFELRDVPAGLVVVTGSHTDYVTGSEQKDLAAGEAVDVVIRLERARNETLAERLENDGKVDLYGIYFDTDKDVLKPESEAALQQVLAMLQSRPLLRIMIAGHTDSQASDAYNAELSRRRAQAVMTWLVKKGIDAPRLAAQGFGESQPVADNGSDAGRALNRRVEIRDLAR